METAPERRRWLDRWMPWIVAVLAVAVAVSISIATVGIKLNGERVAQINAERAENIERACREVNARHDNTIRALDDLIAKRAPSLSPAQRARVRESRENTVLLVQALVPRRDCAALVAAQVAEK